MYKNILVPVVFDEPHKPNRALDAAKALASKGAKITLFHVIEELPSYAAAYLTGDYQERNKAELTGRLTGIAADIPGAEAVVTTGHSARTILDYAGQNNIDCIVVSSHKPGVQDYFLGGTAARVVRYAQCAVHVIR